MVCRQCGTEMVQIGKRTMEKTDVRVFRCPACTYQKEKDSDKREYYKTKEG